MASYTLQNMISNEAPPPPYGARPSQEEPSSYGAFPSYEGVSSDDVLPSYEEATRTGNSHRGTIGHLAPPELRANIQLPMWTARIPVSQLSFPEVFRVEHGIGRRYSREYYIYGNHEPANAMTANHDLPLYLIVAHPLWIEGREELAIHNGSESSSPMLENINYRCTHRCVVISLPVPATSTSRRPSRLRFRGVREVPLDDRRFLCRTVCFGMETTSGPNGAPCFERFEWRHSQGPEVSSLGGDRWGWKLVRLSSTDSSDERGNRHSNNNTNAVRRSNAKIGNARTTGQSSNGREVVAVWANCDCNYMDGAANRVMRFRFIGSGANDLGERFKVAAGLSAVFMWKRDISAELRANSGLPPL